MLNPFSYQVPSDYDEFVKYLRSKYSSWVVSAILASPRILMPTLYNQWAKSEKPINLQTETTEQQQQQTTQKFQNYITNPQTDISTLNAISQPPAGYKWQFNQEFDQTTGDIKGSWQQVYDKSLVPGATGSRTQPNVTSSGGYDWEWTPDTNGGGTWDLIGQTPTQDNQQWSPDQLAQADYYRAQTEALRNQKSDWLSPQQQAEEKNRWFVDQQRAQASGYDASINKRLEGMNQPKDWINRWFLEHSPNPYPSQQENDTRSWANQLQYSTIPTMEEQSKQVSIPSFGDDITQVKTQLSNLLSQLDSYESARNQPPQAPATPSWVAPLTERGVAGQPISSAGQLLTPSAQSLNWLLPTQSAMLEGLADYTGQDFTDLKQSASNMIPTGTVRKSGWRPAIQRI